MASTYFKIGNVLQRQGKYEEAMKRLEAVLELYLEVLGPDHPEIATIYETIGDALHL